MEKVMVINLIKNAPLKIRVSMLSNSKEEVAFNEFDIDIHNIDFLKDFKSIYEDLYEDFENYDILIISNGIGEVIGTYFKKGDFINNIYSVKMTAPFIKKLKQIWQNKVDISLYINDNIKQINPVPLSPDLDLLLGYAYLYDKDTLFAKN